MTVQMQIWKVIGGLMSLVWITTGAVAQSGQQEGGALPHSTKAQKEVYHQQIMGLAKELSSAGTDEESRSIHERLRQTREQYHLSHPGIELKPGGKEALRQKMEEALKTDPFQWLMHQLRYSLKGARTREGRDAIRAQMRNLRVKRATDEEAGLTPEQKTERSALQEKHSHIRAEVEPINAQYRAAKTPEERKSIRAIIQTISEKYR